MIEATTDPDARPAFRMVQQRYDRDTVWRALMSVAAAGRRTVSAAAEAARTHLERTGEYTPDQVAGMVEAFSAKAATIAGTLTPEEFDRRVRHDLVPFAADLVAAVPAVSAKLEKGRDNVHLVRARRKRALPVFAGQIVSSQIGAVLVGPPPLVARALAGVRAAAGGLRIVTCSATRADAIRVVTPQEVTYNAPWWDAAYSSRRRFVHLVDQAEDLLGGLTDLLLVDDLGYLPHTQSAVHPVPCNWVARAVFAYSVFELVARARGGAVLAGLPLRENSPYAHRDMLALVDKCKKYDLSEEEDGLLFATDGYGHRHPIAEPEKSCSNTTTTS